MERNRTDEQLLDEWNDSLTKYLIPNDIILGLYMLIGIGGNSMVILVYIFKMKIKRDDRFFIPILSSIDFIACLVGGGFSLLWNMIPVKFNNEYACKTLWFCSQASTISSGSVLLIIAVHRYIKVCKPMVTFPQKLKYMSIVLSILVGAAFSVPVFFFYGKVDVINPSLNITGCWCGQKRQNVEHVIYYHLAIVVIVVISISTLVVLYILIGRKIYHKFIIFKKSIKQGKYNPSRSDSIEMDNIQMNENLNQQLRGNNTSSKSRANSIDNLVEGETYRRKIKRGSEDIIDQRRFFTIGQHFRKHRYSYMFMTITALFIIAYTPRVTLNVLETLIPNFWEKPSVEISGFLILYRMYILNHAINPFIYTFFDTRFRKEISKIFVCCSRKTRQIKTTHL